MIRDWFSLSQKKNHAPHFLCDEEMAMNGYIHEENRWKVNVCWANHPVFVGYIYFCVNKMLHTGNMPLLVGDMSSAHRHLLSSAL